MEYNLETCPNCKSCEDCPSNFEKVHIKSAGLCIYRNSVTRQDVNNHTDQTESFIIFNAKNIDMNSEKLISKLEKYKKCPRCKYILDHAEKILHNIPKINKLDVLGICNKCWTKDRHRHSACVCSEAIEKFIKKHKETEFNDIKYELHKVTNPSTDRREPQISQANNTKKVFHQKSFAARDRTTFNKNMGYPLSRISTSQESLTKKYLDFPLAHRTVVRKGPASNHDRGPFILDLIAEHNRNKKEYSKKATLEFEPFDTQFKVNRNEEEYITNKETRKKTNSAISLPSSKTFSDDVPYVYLSKPKDFSYFFMKDNERPEKPIQRFKNSSELIKDTLDMLRTREENVVRNCEENTQNKIFDEDKKRKSLTKTLPKFDSLSMKEIKKVRSKEEQEKEMSRSEADRKLYGKVKPKKEKETETLEIRAKESSRKEKESRKKNKEEIESEKKVIMIREHEKIDKSSNVKQKLDREHAIKYKNIERDSTRALNKEEKSPFKKDKETREKRKDTEGSTKEKIIQSEKDKEISMENIKMEQEREDMLLIMTRDKGEQKRGTKKEKPKKGAEQEVDIKKHHSSVWKKAMEDAASKLKMLQEMDKWSDFEVEPKIHKLERKVEEPKFKELNINQIKVMKPSCDDLILQLVKIKQQDVKDKKKRVREISEIQIPRLLIEDHRDHKGFKTPNCIICNDSELELDIEEIINRHENLADTEIIMGQKILKCKLQLSEKFDKKQSFPIYVSTFNEDSTNVPDTNNGDRPVALVRHKPRSASEKYAEFEVPKGVIRYALSDRTFIEKGWTMLPTEKVVRKMNVYRMRPAHPEFDWFEHNKNKKTMLYDSGEKLAEFDENGRGRLYYRSGRLALDYYNAEEMNAQQRYVIHSSGEPDARGCSRPLAILATFDYLGNGIVFDHAGKIRLKYNQTEGVVLDRSIGPVSHWKWHTLNDPPVLQQVMIDTQMAHKDPEILKLGGPQESQPRPDNEEMLAIEFDNFIKEKSKKLSQKFKPFQIKMKALKINEHFSLRVLDQATIYLIFRDGSSNIKLNLGMILDHQEIVDTDTAELGEVSNSLERFPARTDSLAGLQKSVAYAQRIERARVERERRLRPTQPCSSTDKLHSAVSRPLRVPLRTAASECALATCTCRKRCSSNIYYDTRLM